MTRWTEFGRRKVKNKDRRGRSRENVSTAERHLGRSFWQTSGRRAGKTSGTSGEKAQKASRRSE